MQSEDFNLKLSHPQWMWILGLPIVAVSLPFLAIGVLLMTVMHTMGRFGGVLHFFIYLVGAISLWIGMIVYNFGRRFLAIKEEYKTLRDERPHALYLRSFNDDPVTSTRIYMPSRSTGSGIFAVPRVTVRTEEEAIFRILNRTGPPIAIGIPGERLPRVGMPRLYVTDNEWEKVVQKLMNDAPLVIIRIGTTNGVSREVEMAIKTLKPERLLLLLPYEKKPGQSENILSMLNTLLPQKKIHSYHAAKVRDLSIAGIVYFEADWNPHLVELYYHSLNVVGDIKYYAEDILESAFSSISTSPKHNVDEFIGPFVTKETVERTLKALEAKRVGDSKN